MRTKRSTSVIQLRIALLFIAIAILYGMVSCDKADEPEPKIVVDPFVGTWELYNTATLKVSFQVAKGANEEYIFSNITIVDTEIPSPLPNRKIEIYDKYAGGDGFGKIQISASNDTFWVIINLVNNKIDSNRMFVYLMEVYVINRNPYEFNGMEFRKK